MAKEEASRKHPFEEGCSSGVDPSNVEKKVKSDEDASDEEVSGGELSDGYGSLDGGTRRRSGPFDKDGKPEYKEEEEDDDDASSPPRSPKVDHLKSGKTTHVSRLVIDQLRVSYGRNDDKVVEAKVTPTVQPTTFVVSRVLFSKLGNVKWRVVQSHKTGDTSYVYIKMRYMDMVRFRGKRYEWGGSQATFSKVTVLPLFPDPMDAHQVVKIF